MSARRTAPGTGFDCAVIGGGVMGCSTALHLARGGMRVVLLDRGSLCREASGTNAGTLTMQMTRAALVPYALRGFEMWRSAREWLGMDLGMRALDGLSLAFTEPEAEMLRQRAADRRSAGSPIEIIAARRARAIEPGLGERVLLAAHCPIDGFVVAYYTGLAFRRSLLSSGVELREHHRVQQLDRAQGGFVIHFESNSLRAKRVVLAGGVWLDEMLPWLGVNIRVQCLVNQLLITERAPPLMRSVIGVANGKLSLKQFDNGTVLVGGGWQGIGDPRRGGVELVPEHVVGNLMLAGYAIPALKSVRVVRTWLGLEAETADAMPLAGPVPGVANAWVLGSVHSGYTSGPYFGQLLAQAMLDREPELPLFDPRRLLPSTATTGSRC